MIDWKEVSKLRVTTMLASLCEDMVNAPVEFYGSAGELRSSSKGRRRSMCAKIAAATPQSGTLCAECHHRLLKRAEKVRKAVVTTCGLGISRVAAQVKVHAKRAGHVCIGGYRRIDLKRPSEKTILADAEKRKIKNYKGRFGSRARQLSKDQAEIVTRLIEITAREIDTFHREIVEKEKEIERLSKELRGRYSFDQIIGKSAPMQEMLHKLEKIIDTPSTVLIQGETGTGKDVIARAIHYNSARRDRPYVAESCTNLPEQLLESELFGHEKGAFTGAVSRKRGLFEVANGGTIFLDEIGDVPRSLQAKLLRFLEERKFRRVGGTSFHETDVRILAATNQDLAKQVESGSFRSDLFYRLNVISFRLPALRERLEDVPLLAKHFMQKFCERNNCSLKEISSEAMQLFKEYDWPGNVRELENEIEKMVALAVNEKRITIDMVSEDIAHPSISKQFMEGTPSTLPEMIKQTSENMEKEIILHTLNRTQWNKSKVADVLGISRRNLLRKIREYQLERREQN